MTRTEAIVALSDEKKIKHPNLPQNVCFYLLNGTLYLNTGEEAILYWEDGYMLVNYCHACGTLAHLNENHVCGVCQEMVDDIDYEILTTV